MTHIGTLKEMVEYRGYTIESENEHCFISIKGDKENTKICVIKPIISQFNVEKFQQTIGQLNTLNIKHCIIVYEKITHTTKNRVTDLQHLGYKLEFFLESELIFNPTKHYLVSPHIKVLSDEVKEIKTKVKLSDLPKILKTDPIVKFCGFEKGDVIKILRKNKPLVYRVVI